MARAMAEYPSGQPLEHPDHIRRLVVVSVGLVAHKERV